MKTIYIVEFCEEKTQRFRAVRLELQEADLAFVDVELMKAGESPAKILRVYPEVKPTEQGAAQSQPTTEDKDGLKEAAAQTISQTQQLTLI